jgi:hypothetical protein
LTILLAVAFTLGGFHWAGAQDPVSKPDPIVGHWIWDGNRDVTLNADGTGKQHDATIQWKLLDTAAVERKYELNWSIKNGHIYIEKLQLSNDGTKLEGRNQKGARVSAKRVEP